MVQNAACSAGKKDCYTMFRRALIKVSLEPIISFCNFNDNNSRDNTLILLFLVGGKLCQSRDKVEKYLVLKVNLAVKYQNKSHDVTKEVHLKKPIAMACYYMILI